MIAAQAENVARNFTPQREDNGEEEFEEDLGGLVDALEAEQERTLSDKEVGRMYGAAARAAQDPRTKDSSDVWKATAKEATDLNDSRNWGDYIDQRLKESDEQQQEQEAEEATEDQTPAEYLKDLEQDEDDYREALDAAVRGEGSSPIDEYTHPSESE